jgi:NitT/TauT family transport system substrate-binding protein
MNSRLTAIVASLVACLLILLWYQSATGESKKTVTLIPITIADTGTSPPGLLLQLALQQGFFEAEGLRPVITTQFGHGSANIDAVLRGDADIATASEVPVMRAGLDDKKIRVLATIGRGDRHMALVARKDRGVATLGDLSGKILGITVGSNAEYFFDTLLTSNGHADMNVSKVHTLPRDMARTLAAGEVDAVVSWFPNWKHAQEALGDKVATFHGDGIYTVFFNLLSSRAFIARNPEAVSRLLRVFIKTEEYARAHAEEAKSLMKKIHRLSDAVANEVFDNYALQVWLGQELLIALENETQWSMAKGLTKRTEMPNYLTFIHIESLDKLAPHAVSIIH